MGNWVGKYLNFFIKLVYENEMGIDLPRLLNTVVSKNPKEIKIAKNNLYFITTKITKKTTSKSSSRNL